MYRSRILPIYFTYLHRRPLGPVRYKPDMMGFVFFARRSTRARSHRSLRTS